MRKEKGDFGELGRISDNFLRTEGLLEIVKSIPSRDDANGVRADDNSEGLSPSRSDRPRKLGYSSHNVWRVLDYQVGHSAPHRYVAIFQGQSMIRLSSTFKGIPSENAYNRIHRRVLIVGSDSIIRSIRRRTSATNETLPTKGISLKAIYSLIRAEAWPIRIQIMPTP